MPVAISATEIAERGRTIYRERLQAEVEAKHRGEYLVLDVDSGEYALGADEETALSRIEELRPDGKFYLLRVGYTASLFIGSRAA
jgi:hypothetical protein